MSDLPFSDEQLDQLARLLLCIAAGRRPSNQQREHAIEIFDTLFRAGALR